MTMLKRRRNWLITGAGLAALGLGLTWRQQTGPTLSAEALAFWSSRFDRPEGGELITASMKGRPLLLNFWATWCPPCVRELPELDAFHAAHEAEGFAVIGAAVDEGGAAAVKPFVERHKLGYPVVLASAETQGLFGGVPMDPTGPAGFPLPTTFIIGRDGRFVARYVGALTQAELDKVVLPLLRR